MRRPDLAADAALATVQGRRQHEDRIEAAIARWASLTRPDPAMAELQAEGIPAGVARVPRDLLADPHLLTMGHWQPLDRPFTGPHLMPTVAYREDNARLPAPIRSAAPTLGQHNAEVLGGLLGLTAAELAGLEQRGVIGTVSSPIPAEPRKAAANA
jgi:crotonobetainyl-CoA:carnitine CoA-transferase CaiB-like acyl-CoA transferase